MKKKLFALAVCVAMLSAAIVGGTMAYFTDEDVQENTFTAGKVGIALDEAVVEADEVGNLVATNERTSGDQSYHLYPAQVVTKDPTITVDSDSEEAYVAAVINVTGDLYGLIGVDDAANIDITRLASGGLMAKTAEQVSDWNGLAMVYETEDCVIYQAAAEKEWTLYIFMKEAQAADAKIVLFDTLTIPAEWDNLEMEKISGMKINVKAYATQKVGFTDCYSAMTTAFASDFNF